MLRLRKLWRRVWWGKRVDFLVDLYDRKAYFAPWEDWPWDCKYLEEIDVHEGKTVSEIERYWVRYNRQENRFYFGIGKTSEAEDLGWIPDRILGVADGFAVFVKKTFLQGEKVIAWDLESRSPVDEMTVSGKITATCLINNANAGFVLARGKQGKYLNLYLVSREGIRPLWKRLNSVVTCMESSSRCNVNNFYFTLINGGTFSTYRLTEAGLETVKKVRLKTETEHPTLKCCSVLPTWRCALTHWEQGPGAPIDFFEITDERARTIFSMMLDILPFERISWISYDHFALEKKLHRLGEWLFAIMGISPSSPFSLRSLSEFYFYRPVEVVRYDPYSDLACLGIDHRVIVIDPKTGESAKLAGFPCGLVDGILVVTDGKGEYVAYEVETEETRVY